MYKYECRCGEIRESEKELKIVRCGLCGIQFRTSVATNNEIKNISREKFNKVLTDLISKIFELSVEEICELRFKLDEIKIKKEPEPAQPIIKKSGETWVVFNNDIDYLFLSDSNYTKENIDTHFHCYLEGLNFDFKPISEIKLTDKIAKLRPMVIHHTLKKPVKLLYYSKDMDFPSAVLMDNGFLNRLKNVELATIDNLP